MAEEGATIRFDPLPPLSLETLDATVQAPDTVSLQLRLLIAARDAGCLLGSKGAHMNALRQCTRTRIKLSPTQSGVHERVVTVQGTPVACARAVTLMAVQWIAPDWLSPLCPEDETEMPEITPEQRLVPFQELSSLSQQLTAISLMLPDGAVGAVMGRGGQRIRALQQHAQVRIQAGPQSLPYSNERLVTVSGAPEGILEALYQLVLLVVQWQEKSATGPHRFYQPSKNHPVLPSRLGSPPPQPNSIQPNTDPLLLPVTVQSHSSSSEDAKDILQVPLPLVGVIIGPRGDHIRELRRTTGAHVRVGDPDSMTQGLTRPVIIRGTAPQVQQAIELIKEMCETERVRLLAQQASASAVPLETTDQ